MNKQAWIVVGVLIFVLLCCICSLLFFGGLAVYRLINTTDIDNGTPWVDVIGGSPTETPVVIRPTLESTLQVLETPIPGNTQILDNVKVPTDTLEVLKSALVPNNDLIGLAYRLQGKEDIPATVAPPAMPLQAGTQDTFWVTNVDTNESFQVNATLQYVTDHAYFWIEDGVRFDEGDLRDLAEEFEYKIYPTNREFFGSEWTPGIDGDPHLYILFARGIGSSLAGYFSSADEVHPLAHEYSNAHEMFLMNIDNLALNDLFTYSVLAHEFQHMIHWYQDRNETSWLNEGFSELAAFLNGYSDNMGGFDFLFALSPDIQVNDWPNDPNATTPHYGAAFLFVTYFLDRFGEQATRALVSHPENGLESMDEVLANIELKDDETDAELNADDVFMDWVTALYLQDTTIADGRYGFHNYQNVPDVQVADEVTQCPQSVSTRDVHQYGVDYILIGCPGEYVLRFEGSITTKVVPQNPHSGEYMFWSNKGDESDMTLTREFDLTNVSGPVTLEYWTWYDIEEDYDYVYVEASLDGERWEILTTPSGTDKDPTGNSYGWAYNGTTDGWIKEAVDLTSYAGKKIFIRFEYVTDAAVNGEGFLIDDVSVPQAGYFTDFEQDDGGWYGEGFVRMRNILPQYYGLRWITVGDEITITPLKLNPDNTLDLRFQIGGSVDYGVLVVSGLTRYTREKAAYRYQVVTPAAVIP